MTEKLKKVLKSLTPLIIIYFILAFLFAKFFKGILCQCLAHDFGPFFAFAFALVLILIHFLLYYNLEMSKMLKFISVVLGLIIYVVSNILLLLGFP